MPKSQFIHLRYPDGREQRIVNSPNGERVAKREEERGAKRFEPAAPYTAEDAAKAAKAIRRTERAQPATAAEAPAAEQKDKA